MNAISPMMDAMAQLQPRVADLAEAVSPAIRIESQLVRKMRLELFPNMDAGVEADLWFSSAVESRTPSGIVFEPSAARALRERLRQKPRVLDAAWRVIESLHRNIS